MQSFVHEGAHRMNRREFVRIGLVGAATLSELSGGQVMAASDGKVGNDKKGAFVIQDASISDLQMAMQNGKTTSAKLVSAYLERIKKIDAIPNTIETTIAEFELDAIQLYHDDISVFQYLRPKVKIIKAIAIKTEADIANTKIYNDQCDLFLFDTKGEKAGGNGIKFDWHILSSYQSEKPFILSGGIDLYDVEVLRSINHQKLYGIDINSKFEIKPGIKNIKKIKQFKNNLYENIEHIK